MATDSFRIVFKGEILPEKDLAVVKVSIAQIFKLKTEQVQNLFSGKTVSVKRGLDTTMAEKFRKAFERAGARAYVVAENGAPSNGSNADVGTSTTLRRGAPVQMTCPDCNQEQPLAPTCAFCGWTSSSWEA